MPGDDLFRLRSESALIVTVGPAVGCIVRTAAGPAFGRELLSLRQAGKNMSSKKRTEPLLETFNWRDPIKGLRARGFDLGLVVGGLSIGGDEGPTEIGI